MSQAEALLMLHIQADDRLKRWTWEREYRFGAMACGGPGKGLRARLAESGLKDWRFDFAVPELWIAVEVEGGGWTGGRHTSGKGFEADMRKYDAGLRLGWRIYRCSPAMVKQGHAVETIAILVDQAAQKPTLAAEG